MGNPKLVKPDLNSKSYNVVPMFNWWAIQLYISRVAGSIMFEERISKGKKKDGKEGKAGPFDFCYYGCAVQTHTHVVIVVKQGNWQKAQQSHRGEKPRGSRQGLRRDQRHCCQILFGGMHSRPFWTYRGVRFTRSQIHLFFDVSTIPKLTILSIWVWNACKNKLKPPFCAIAVNKSM